MMTFSRFIASIVFTLSVLWGKALYAQNFAYPQLDDGNPLPLLLDPKAFIGNQSLLLEGVWSDSRRKIFGKAPTDWTENDFKYLEYRLRQQIGLELDEAKKYVASHGSTRLAEQDSIYLLRKKNLENAIATIPKMKYWAEQEKQHLLEVKAADVARQQQQEAQHRQQEIEREQARLARIESEKQQQLEVKQRAAEQEQRMFAEQKAAEVRVKEAQRKRNLFLLALIPLAILAGYVWHRFFRKRCPHCKSLNHNIANEVEIERFRGLQEVREQTTRGSKTRSINTLMHKVRYDHHCDDCGHDWSHIVRKPV